VKRALGIAAVLLVVGGVVGALTFPTDALVQAVLDRAPLPDRMQLTFAGARLRPNGLRLEQVHIVRQSGQPAFDAEWLRLRPSLLGLWSDRTGRPWSIGAGSCQGTIEMTIGVEPRGTPIEVTLEHVEVATCLPYVFPHVEAYGRVDGTFSVRIADKDRNASTGALQLRGAAWKPGIGPLEDVTLHADAGALDWQLADGRLELTKIEATSKDFEATGGGLVHVLDPIDYSEVNLQIAVTPGPTMPPLLRRYFDAIVGAAPDARGTRTFRIVGPLRDPRVSATAPLPPRP
jgi:type II secretion system protein N